MKLQYLLRGGLLAALTISSAQAQPSSTPPSIGQVPITVEGYYTHYRLDAEGNDRLGMNGIAARLMWNADALVPGTALESRVAAGLFAEYAPTQDRGFSLLHAGVQGDVRLTSAPLFGRVTPLGSLALGALWTDVEDGPAAIASRFPLGTRSTGTFALSPSVGARIALWRQLGFRADVRDVITFRHRTLHNMQLASGLSFEF